ncbi:MAG TPA: pitrilysin family protein [Candidatus Limnocylindrales bacterium]|nr:pitrilysin family protein [Candidatus Limnocylindrales bacterium]
MRVARRRLDNGLRIAVVPIADLRSASVILTVEAGQWFEPVGRPGIARLTAQTMLRGTRGKSANEWAEAIDALGAAARLDVGSHAGVFGAQCLDEDIPALLGLMSETLRTPALNPDDLEFVRGQTLAQLERDERDTRAVVERVWRSLVYPRAHPFHEPGIGDAEVVRTATVEEIRDYHESAIRPDGAILIVAGAASVDGVVDAANRAFGGWRSNGVRDQRDVPEVALAATIERTEVVPDKTQSDVLIGWPGIPRSDPRFTAARVTNMVYAADTFASRAGNVIRDQLGLAYYVFSGMGSSRGQSPWVVRMGVNPANVRRAMEVALDELRKITQGDIADDDLSLAKDKLVGELDVALESPAGVASMVLETELFDLGEDHLERYPNELRAITKQQVVETARTVLPPERHAAVVAGPPLPDRA